MKRTSLKTDGYAGWLCAVLLRLVCPEHSSAGSRKSSVLWVAGATLGRFWYWASFWACRICWEEKWDQWAPSRSEWHHWTSFQWPAVGRSRARSCTTRCSRSSAITRRLPWWRENKLGCCLCWSNKFDSCGNLKCFSTSDLFFFVF